MDRFREERAETARIALGVTDTVDAQFLADFLDWLGDCVTVQENAPVTKPGCSMLAHGRALILLPRAVSRGELTDWKLHEGGHFLLKHGAGSYFRMLAASEEQADRFRADLWEAREEAEVQAFILAVFAPSQLVAMIRHVEELAEITGLSAELVQKRIEQLSGKMVYIRNAPDWSAWHRYRVEYVPSPLCGRLCVVPREGGGPVYEIPVTEGAMTEWRFRLNADLAAFTPEEFAAKYRYAEAPGTVQNATMDLQALYTYISRHRKRGKK